MNDAMSFEDALAALEAKVEELSHGDLPLDRALTAYEEGLALFRRCHDLLAKAEQRVTRLVAATDGLSEEPLRLE